MDFKQSLQYLQSVQGENQKLVLENIEKVIEHFPVDFKRISYLQVAGTNGKGSTSSYLASILQHAGHRVGLFTSPHLQDVRERIAINGRMISRLDFALCLSEVKHICADLMKKKIVPNLPTFFENLFLLALLYFQKQGVEWAVLEVGLGGRLDATTTVTPKISIITNVSKDHTNILGKTIKKIAREKAGIIRRGVPVVCGCMPHEAAFRVIRDEAARRGAQFYPVFNGSVKLTWTTGTDSYDCLYQEKGKKISFQVRMCGEHQCRNAAVAIKTICLIREQGIPISDHVIARGISCTRIPARIEWIKPHSGFRSLVLDGGHNPEGIQALADYLQQKGFFDKTLIFGVLGDKDYRTMAKRIARFARDVILTKPVSARALPPEKLVPFFTGKSIQVENDNLKALEIAKKIKNDIIITGSLYLAGEMRTLILRRKKRERKPL